MKNQIPICKGHKTIYHYSQYNWKGWQTINNPFNLTLNYIFYTNNILKNKSCVQYTVLIYLNLQDTCQCSFHLYTKDTNRTTLYKKIHMEN